MVVWLERDSGDANGAFVKGSGWASWGRDLFVATLKEQDVRRFDFNHSGSDADARTPVLFDNRWGRLRGVVRPPGSSALYLTTSNGDGNDRVIRVRPAG